MACGLWTYDSIRGVISGHNITREALEDLKHDFAEEINSRRRLDCINSLEDLLDILERRDVINPANIGPLEHICNLLGDKSVINALANYQPEEQYGYENEYEIERIEYENKEKALVEELKNGGIKPNNPVGKTPELEVQPSKCALFPQVLSDKKRDQVYDLIAREIGKSWRDFGREIGVENGELENLETDYPRNSKLKIRKMMESFEEDEKVDPKEIVSCICKALIVCRRPDLSRDIQKILR